MSPLTPLQGAEAQQLAGDLPNANIPLYDEFNNPQGQWINYTTYGNTDQVNLLNQKHIDIRSFNQAGITASRTMTWFDAESVSELEAFTVAQLEGNIQLQSGEAWTSGTVGVLAGLNSWNGIQLACVSGINTTQSIITNTNSGRVIRINILTGFQDTDHISIALPEFPLSSIDTANSFIDFTSANDGSFPNGHIDSVAFNQSSTTLQNGPSEFSFPRSLIVNSDLTQITGIRFRITATANCTVTIVGIRLLASTWQFASYDQDTLWNYVRLPVSKNGDSTTIPYTMPPIWKSNVPSGVADPKPVDASVAITFNTGQMISTNGWLYPSPTLAPSTTLTMTEPSKDSITLYFRETTQSEMVQSSLDLLTMDGLTGYIQPDYGTDSVIGATMEDIEVYQQQYLDSLSQYNVETKPNTINGSWISMKLEFNTTNTKISIVNAFNVGYDYSYINSLQPDTDYILICTVEDTRGRIQIYPLASNGDILVNEAIFDSGWIVDTFLFKRRQGRFGWSASIQRGDFKLYNIRSRYTNYGEYRTAQFESVTPVTGVQIQVDGYTGVELFKGWDIGPYGGNITLVPSDPTVHQVLQITNTGLSPYQGVQSNQFYIDNFDAMELNLDILFPSTSIDAPLRMYLLGEKGNEIDLPLIITNPDQWQHINLHTLTNGLAQTGPYRLVIVQPITNIPTVWQIDNPSIQERGMNWAARTNKSDAWNDIPAPWVNFYSLINDRNKGIVFDKRDRFLQVQAKMLRQDAYIANLTITPKYAQLGRFVWPDEAPPLLPPVPNVYTSTNGYTVSFDASGSTDLYGRIINYEWNFGDGYTDFGSIVEHTYVTHGYWSITLTVINDQGAVASLTKTLAT